MKKYIPSLIMVVFFSLQGWATNYYVSGSGSNTNNGLSASSAFRDLQKAADLTQPGDTVFVMNGLYSNSCSTCDGINISRSGTASKWIVYKAYPGHAPKIKFNSWQGVRIVGASYIEINGFEIEGNNSSITLAYAQSQASNVNNPTTSGNGIYMDVNGGVHSHHIRILNNSIYNCGGHGIGSHWADYITIDNNRIYNNAWYSPLGCSGISLYQNWNYDTFSGVRINIRNNTIYNNIMYIPFYYNGKIEDGNGIIIDDARNTQNGSTYGVYNGTTRIENNVVFDNGGRGIHAFYSNNIEVVNNTTYQNCKSPEVKDGELSGYAVDNAKFYNNATYSRSDARANHGGDGTSTNIAFNYNIYYNFNTSMPITKGANDIVADPKFVNPSTDPSLANFHLQAGSPGIDNGTSTLAAQTDKDKNTRPLGLGYDRGAYEYKSTANAAPSVSLTSPASGASYTVGTAIPLAANASDADGTVSKVEFFAGTTKLGEDLTSPYTYSWTNAVAGTYSITAKATDNAGAVTTSAAVNISVTSAANAAPSVSLTSPASGASYTVGTAIPLSANASDADGTVSKVEFFAGTTKLGEDLTSPYTYSWTNAAAGTYSITARATDNAGAATTSAPVSITVTSSTVSNCTTLAVPAATQFVVRNNWGDQNNGSGVSNTTDALKVTHRAWGNNYLWVIRAGAATNVTAGKEYTITYDFLDDAVNKVTSTEVGFAKSYDASGPVLLQSSVVAPAGYSSSSYTTKSVKFTATASGTVYLSFKLNWAGQPNQQVNDYIKNISICEAAPAARIAAPDAAEASSISVAPNPFYAEGTLLLRSDKVEEARVEVRDLRGALVSSGTYLTNTPASIGSNLNPGVYIVEAVWGGVKRTVRIVKE